MIPYTARDKPTVPEVLPLVRAYYSMPGNGAGGSLHVVLDDGNIDDYFVRSCLLSAQESGDAAGAGLAALLLKMSKTQRSRLIDALDLAMSGA